MKDSHEATDQLGCQDTDDGHSTKDADPKGATSQESNSKAHTEQPIGASVAQIWEPEEEDPKGANTSESKELEEPKGGPSLESNRKSHTERPIGASAAQIWGPEEEEPKVANTSETKELEEPKGDSRKESTTMVEEETIRMGEASGNVAAGEGALGSAEQIATNPRQTHTCGQEQHA